MKVVGGEFMYLKTFENSLNLFWIRLLEIESKEKNCMVLCKIQTKVAAAARYKYDEVNRHIYIYKYVYMFVLLEKRLNAKTRKCMHSDSTS